MITPYHVIHPQTHNVVATVETDRVIFSEEGKELQKILRHHGISIPASQSGNFDGYRTLYPDQAKFVQAFDMFYVPHVLKKSGFFQLYHQPVNR